MWIVRRLLCRFRGHRWRARRFDFQGTYCEACDRCGEERNDHNWEGCRCAKCGVPNEPADLSHDWHGCTCTACGLQRHQWTPWNEGKRCRLCGEQSLSWNDYLRATIGKSYGDDADFVLAVGEAIRQEVFRKYEKARDAFRLRRKQRTMLLYQAVLIAETTETAKPREVPKLAHTPVVPAQYAEREAARVERPARRERN